MTDLQLKALLIVLQFLLFIALYTAAFRLMAAMLRKRRVIRLSVWKDIFSGGSPPAWLLRTVGRPLGHPDKWAERKQLLLAAGIRFDPLWYLCMKRLLVLVMTLAAVLAVVFRSALQPYLPVHPAAAAALAGAAALLVGSDRLALNALRTYRTNRMVEEIFDVSRQLLYFCGSPLHLHGKLARCLPYTKLLRTDWHLLLNDWYQDAEGAIRRFRDRLGTDEAHAFAETLQSLRTYDGDAYYDLIRQRVQDYKEKLELIRDSRKESASYGLFVLAGIPILYTFQIFIHPWVQEGIKLFNTLNG